LRYIYKMIGDEIVNCVLKCLAIVVNHSLTQD